MARTRRATRVQYISPKSLKIAVHKKYRQAIYSFIRSRGAGTPLKTSRDTYHQQFFSPPRRPFPTFPQLQLPSPPGIPVPQRNGESLPQHLYHPPPRSHTLTLATSALIFPPNSSPQPFLPQTSSCCAPQPPPCIPNATPTRMLPLQKNPSESAALSSCGNIAPATTDVNVRSRSCLLFPFGVLGWGGGWGRGLSAYR